MTKKRADSRGFMNRNLSKDLIELFEAQPTRCFSLTELAGELNTSRQSVRQCMYNLRNSGALAVRGEFIYRLRRSR